jgi:hypothetical protein
MGIWIYLLLHLIIVLWCVHWARAKGHPVLLLGGLACVAGPVMLLALPFVKPPSGQPTSVVSPPAATDAAFSAATGPLGGYAAPGPPATRPTREPIYTPLILNGIGVLLLVALGESGSDEWYGLLVVVPLVTLVNSILFVRAFEKRAFGLAFLYSLPALGGLSLLIYVFGQIAHVFR